jgi:hypothetical protein
VGDQDSADIQARIKKIMQMDEEVGKLASATPVMICMSPSSSLLFISYDQSETYRHSVGHPNRENTMGYGE